MNVLDKILKVKKMELVALQQDKTIAMNKGPSLLKALSSTHPSLIAEIKPKSPSAGLLFKPESLPIIIEAYNKHAQAISVLCDSSFFGGSYELLAYVRARTSLPILAKEFIIDTRQIDVCLQAGGNAILLIAAIVTQEALNTLLHYAAGKNLDVLIETHDTDDIEKALHSYHSLTLREKKHVALGINNRNLRTLSIDLYTTIMLSRHIHDIMAPREVPVLVSESGIERSADIKLLMPHVQGFLVGSSLLRSEDIETRVQQLFHSL